MATGEHWVRSCSVGYQAWAHTGLTVTRPVPPIPSVTQRTLVIKVPQRDHASLQTRLEPLNLEWRSVPHAQFSVRGMGVVATLYRSGKFVVQGAEPEGFVAQHTDLDVPQADPKDSSEELSAESDTLARIPGPIVGSDEAGKGDYFGPLTVAAVRLEPDQAQTLIGWGVTDSKRLTDPRALKLAALLRAEVSFAVEHLNPSDYNKEYARVRNLNPMLAGLHARAIGSVAHPGDSVIVDQFANEALMREALEGKEIHLYQAPRAERHVAVAAASILARAEFLLGLAELEVTSGFQLHKGAGAPVDQAGAAIARAQGLDALEGVAKLHFKTTDKIAKRLS